MSDKTTISVPPGLCVNKNMLLATATVAADTTAVCVQELIFPAPGYTSTTMLCITSTDKQLNYELEEVLRRFDYEVDTIPLAATPDGYILEPILEPVPNKEEPPTETPDE